MYRCNQCPKMFKELLDLKRHLSRKHFNYIPYLCKICKKQGQFLQTATDEDMDKHFETVHPGTKQSITLSREKDIEDKIKASIEECRLSALQNISLEDFKSDLQSNDQSPFGKDATGKEYTSSRVAQEQSKIGITENVAEGDIEITYESVAPKETGGGTALKGISLDFKSALRRVYNVLSDGTCVGASSTEEELHSVMKQEQSRSEATENFTADNNNEILLDILPQAIEDQSNVETTENASTDKNEVYHMKQFQQRDSNVKWSDRAQESQVNEQNPNIPTTSTAESNLSSDNPPTFTSPEFQPFDEFSVISTVPTPITLAEDDLNESHHDSIEHSIQTHLQESSNKSNASLMHISNLSTNDRSGRAKSPLKRSVGIPKTNSAEKPYQCERCSYASVAKSSLICHKRTHTGEKPYKCNKCTFTCAASSHLNYHMRTHTGDKPFKCGQCSYASANKSNLDTHLRAHSGEKPFKCNECSFACAYRHHLNRHIRAHSGQKPYKCIQCPYASAEISKLNIHMRIHTGEKPFKCRVCHFAFAHMNSLTYHARTHTGEKPYKCSDCSFAGISSSQLLQHVRNNHSKETE